MEQYRISSQNAAHVQAYIEYNNIVGTADNGKMFTPEEYEEYKQNLRKNARNKVYCSWRNAKGMDCKTIGPASTCLCGHKFREHNYLTPKDKKVHCKATKCSCPGFYYIPVHGSADLKCLCKASYTDHDPVTKKCPKGKTGAPSGRFTSTWSCSCGAKFGDHVNVVETREERIALGKPVDDGTMGEYGALMGGGLANFSSMVDAADSHAAQIDAIGYGDYGNKAIGYQSQQALPYKSAGAYQEQDLGHRRVAGAMNPKDSLDKQMNALSIRDQGQYGKSDVPEEGVSALDLYNTPHNFARARITIKKALR